MGFLVYIVNLEVAVFLNYFAGGFQLPRTKRKQCVKNIF